MTVLIRCFLIVLSLTLSACGFRPLYGDLSAAAPVSEELGQVAVEPIETRVGLVLRNDLIDQLSPGGRPSSPRYRLRVVLDENRVESGIRIDASATRFNYSLTANYVLFDERTGTQVLTEASRSIVPYDVPDSQFAVLISGRDAEDRAARDVSEDIKLRLALYFRDLAEEEKSVASSDP